MQNFMELKNHQPEDPEIALILKKNKELIDALKNLKTKLCCNSEDYDQDHDHHETAENTIDVKNKSREL